MPDERRKLAAYAIEEHELRDQTGVVGSGCTQASLGHQEDG